MSVGPLDGAQGAPVREHEALAGTRSGPGGKVRRADVW